jgi:hypothetical protein
MVGKHASKNIKLSHMQSVNTVLAAKIYRVSTIKPGHRHITHIKIIYELL